jgi:hypothetical protein
MKSVKVIADPPAPNEVSGEWVADKITKINDYLYKLEGLCIESTPGQPFIELEGLHILGSYNNYYWHFIHEDLAHYEGLKATIPDLRLTLIDLPLIMKDKNQISSDQKSRYPYLEYFLELYPQEVYLNRNSNIRLETVFFVPTSGDVFKTNITFEEHGFFPKSMVESTEYMQWSNNPWDFRAEYGVTGLKILGENLRAAIEPNSETPEKIFISRRDVNIRLEEYSTKKGYEHLVEERLFKDDELALYFEERGYSVIALEEHSYVKQMQLFMGATHVAGTVGAGFSNLHMCSQGTKFFELHVIPIYGFDYEYYSRVSGVEYLAIELRNLSLRAPLSYKKMIEVLNHVKL